MTLELDLEIKQNIVDMLVAMAGDGQMEEADHLLDIYVLRGKLSLDEALKCWDYMVLVDKGSKCSS